MTTFGTFLKPFAADSLWNSRPIKPVLGDWVIPPCFMPRGSTNKMFPSIAAGAWSTGIYQALPTDPARTIYAPAGKTGILDSDSGEMRPSITIPHWPADAVGAAGGDGHCDIFDEEAGVIHSFWILKPDAAGRFTAHQYSWSPFKKSGFGTASHFSQGARATGVPTCAGMIRKHEVADGKSLFEHALACSLDQSGLAASPAFIPPATMSDWNPEINTGKIPQGALIMLPAGYDTARLARWPLLRKVAETLKVYGARVVDRNEFTPYAIYVENGADWKMSAVVGWDNDLASELEYIRTQLRQVMSQDGFQAGLEDAENSDNLLSLRGPWRKIGGTADEPLYDTLRQGLVMPAVRSKTWYTNTSGLGFRVVDLKPKAGECFRLSYSTTNKSYFRMLVKNKLPSGQIVETNVAPPAPDQFAYVRWPVGGWHELYVTSPDGDVAGVVTARFEKVTEAEYLAAQK